MFFGLFDRKSSLEESGALRGGTDWHCHLLPGVDDGVQQSGETLKILKLYEETGLHDVWFTPHIMEDVPNTTEGLQQRFSEFQKIYQGAITLHLAAEYMMDNLFLERLKANDLLPLGEERNQLLVETSYYNPPTGLYSILEDIKRTGYYPVLAHPERYRYMEMKDYEKLQQMGVRFQLNLPSFIGMYGKEVQERAETLLAKGYYSYRGSDTHRISMLRRVLTAPIKTKTINLIKKV